ncbi:MAG: hypothetical protein EAZ78_00630 [Oscillatoriales cyanobacterium]|uniref:Uncharacterized protein n=1 Tax=Microcoleus anatoxicus PTRS2 TaxID=2705321 RepID=A0ABU8YQY8_9CYAN|nr:MAG: hypothetical protein EA000_09365 [Oscillatoriales cyanobacterium]TAD98717.1 MAG: hypothetical protein EAZ98_05650 [Oscillatoriales cyanobacterium]TAE06970.1 MAG: hypothetical protein EAZ96_00680 [Oscillatoriales cyanobacterium]TAF07135.1 MAG: hypothetical protein EAZ78_00630 [Oscillatoriales cyanobacterium]TAF68498.1 MAG: hypothetical protein EAZ59_10945 [Oscillatoriales cyanobacterium]
MLNIKVLSGSMIAVLLAIGSYLGAMSNPGVAVARVDTNAQPKVANAAQKAASASVAISDRTMGAAQVGMTFGQLKKTLGATAQFKVQSPFMVDFDAVALSQSGKVQYRIIYAAGTRLKDTDVIELLMTDNPNYKTAQGVGPGMTLKQAEAIYGKTTLSYNVDNEMRENVVFANQPTRKIMFVPKADGKQFAGVYGAGKGGFFQTNKYQTNAVIKSVMVRK